MHESNVQESTTNEFLTERDADVSNEQQSSGCYEECHSIIVHALTHPHRQLNMKQTRLYQCEKNYTTTFEK